MNDEKEAKLNGAKMRRAGSNANASASDKVATSSSSKKDGDSRIARIINLLLRSN